MEAATDKLHYVSYIRVLLSVVGRGGLYNFAGAGRALGEALVESLQASGKGGGCGLN